MTTYLVSEIFNETNYNWLETFQTKNEAELFFNKILRRNGFKLTGIKSWVLTLSSFDEETEEIGEIANQVIYSEGELNRMNYKDDGYESPMGYWFEQIWNADIKDTEYTFFFQGKKEEKKVLGKDLQKWFF